MQNNNNNKKNIESENIKVKNLNIGRIIIGLSELGKLSISDFKINLSITKTIAYLSEIEQAFSKSKRALMDSYIAVDDNGSYLVDGGKFFIYKSKKDKEDYIKNVTALDEVENEISFSIKASQLQKISGLTSSTMTKFHELIIDDLK